MKVHVLQTPLAGCVVVTTEPIPDGRGFFVEVFRDDVHGAAGLPRRYRQVNHSGSAHGVIRGLHFQRDPPMGKMMRVLTGEAFLVAVDIRKGSPTLGRWFGDAFAARDGRKLWAPAGFARGFCVLSDYAEIEYFCTATYNAETEGGLAWNDPDIGVEWPVTSPLLSARDARAPRLAEWLASPESEAFRFDADRDPDPGTEPAAARATACRPDEPPTETGG